MKNDPQTELVSVLGRGETILWAGTPRGGFLLRVSDAFMIPFTAFWCALVFAIANLHFRQALESGDTPFNFIGLLFFVPFALMGLHALVGRFFADKMDREKTTYGITNERVIIKSGIIKRTVQSLDLSTLSDVGLEEGRNGYGTITFGPTHPMYETLKSMKWFPGAQNMSHTATFDTIPEAKVVYDLIVKQKSKLIRQT